MDQVARRPLAAAIVAILLGLLLAGPQCLALTFYVNDPAGFDTAAVPANSIFPKGSEDWESSSLGAGNIQSLSPSILLPGVANGPFANGTNPVLGMTVNPTDRINGDPADTAMPTGGLATASPGYFGSPTHQVSPEVAGAGLEMTFDLSAGAEYVSAVHFSPLYFDVVNAIGPTSHPGTVSVFVYDSSGVAIGNTTISNVDYSQGDYLGIVAGAGEDIGRVYIGTALNPGQSTVGFDDITAFYTPIPEPGSTVLLLGAGLALLFRRSRR